MFLVLKIELRASRVLNNYSLSLCYICMLVHCVPYISNHDSYKLTATPGDIKPICWPTLSMATRGSSMHRNPSGKYHTRRARISASVYANERSALPRAVAAL